MDSPFNALRHAIVKVGDKYRYAEYKDHCDQLFRKYSVLRKKQIGESVLGRPIEALVIGTGTTQIHMNGAVHANEWITTPLLLRFIEELAEFLVHSGREPGKIELGKSFHSLKADWANNFTLWVVPMVNPDGADLSQDGIPIDCQWREQLLEWNGGSSDFSRWKANIRGVDLNDQFPSFWELERDRRGIQGPGPQDYGGERPLSEPESAALAELTRSAGFSRVLSLHTQGKEIYWNYRDMEPVESGFMADRLADAGGYRAVKLSGSDAGYKDWFIQEFRRPGFTVEAGEGVNPLPPSQFEMIYAQLSPILVEFLRG